MKILISKNQVKTMKNQTNPKKKKEKLSMKIKNQNKVFQKLNY